MTTATLEVRTGLALAGRIEDAIWDLPTLRLPGRQPVRSVVAGAHEWALGEKGRWVLGRSSGCDIHLDGDDAISRRHAEIAVRAGQCLIRDLDSCNGTLLNGRSVRRARLRRGDQLLLGETELRVR